MRPLITCSLFALTTLMSTISQAQPLLIETQAQDSPWSAFTQAGLDQSLLTLGVGAAWRPQRRLAQLAVSLHTPIFTPDLHDMRLAIDSQWELGRWRNLRLPLIVGLDWVRTSNDTFTGHSLASVLSASPCWQGQGWLIGVELSWRQSWLTHLSHTDYYRQIFFEQVQDGWYSLSARQLRLGLSGAWRMGSVLEGYAKVGLERHGVFNVLIPPYYANVGINVRF